MKYKHVIFIGILILLFVIVFGFLADWYTGSAQKMLYFPQNTTNILIKAYNNSNECMLLTNINDINMFMKGLKVSTVNPNNICACAPQWEIYFYNTSSLLSNAIIKPNEFHYDKKLFKYKGRLKKIFKSYFEKYPTHYIYNIKIPLNTSEKMIKNALSNEFEVFSMDMKLRYPYINFDVTIKSDNYSDIESIMKQWRIKLIEKYNLLDKYDSYNAASYTFYFSIDTNIADITSESSDIIIKQINNTSTCFLQLISNKQLSEEQMENIRISCNYIKEIYEYPNIGN
jgi:hypothetical protein